MVQGSRLQLDPTLVSPPLALMCTLHPTPPHPQVPAEAAAVYNLLAILENCIEVKPALAEQAVEKTKVCDRGRV